MCKYVMSTHHLHDDGDGHDIPLYAHGDMHRWCATHVCMICGKTESTDTSVLVFKNFVFIVNMTYPCL